MYSEYIIFTAYISVAYLNTSNDLVVSTCSNSCLSPLELPVHMLMCWTNGTTLAVKYGKIMLLQKKMILLFLLFCVYIWHCFVSLLD